MPRAFRSAGVGIRAPIVCCATTGLTPLLRNAQPAGSLNFTPDGRRLVTLNRRETQEVEGEARLWDPVRVPSYFTSDAVERIPEGSVALLAPWTTDARNDEPQVWQVMSDFRFKMPSGYAYLPGDDGSVHNESTETFLRNYMSEFRDHIVRVLTVLPR